MYSDWWLSAEGTTLHSQTIQFMDEGLVLYTSNLCSCINALSCLRRSVVSTVPMSKERTAVEAEKGLFEGGGIRGLNDPATGENSRLLRTLYNNGIDHDVCGFERASVSFTYSALFG